MLYFQKIGEARFNGIPRALGYSLSFEDPICKNEKNYCDVVQPDCKLSETRKHCAKYCGVCRGKQIYFHFSAHYILLTALNHFNIF